jgi:hypothetical protein
MEILSTYETFFIIVETPNREGECLYQNKSLLICPYYETKYYKVFSLNEIVYMIRLVYRILATKE